MSFVLLVPIVCTSHDTHEQVLMSCQFFVFFQPVLQQKWIFSKGFYSEASNLIDHFDRKNPERTDGDSCVSTKAF